MKKGRGKRESHYRDIVGKYLHREHGCVTLSELNFNGPKFDMVGFSPRSEEFYIVECKRTSRPVGIGQTFGQILAYKAMLLEAGRKFLSAFEKGLRKKGGLRKPFWEYAARFAERGKIPVRFFVALRQKACTHYDLLRAMKNDLKGVGIIRINDRDQCRNYIRVLGENDQTICRADRLEIRIDRPIRPELQEVLDRRASDRTVSQIASKLDRKITRMRSRVETSVHGHHAVSYRVTRNFVALHPRQKHLRVDVWNGSEWERNRLTRVSQVSGIARRIRKALKKTLD